MNTTLSIIGGTLTLPDDMLWLDEFKWSPVGQAIAVTLGGALIIETANQTFGRPITLGGVPTVAWVTSNVMDALRAAEIAQGDTPMTLTLPDGRTFTVMFLGGQGNPAVSAEQVLARATLDLTERNTLQWVPTIRLIQIG